MRFLREPKSFGEFLIYFFTIYGVISVTNLAVALMFSLFPVLKFQIQGLMVAIGFTLLRALTNSARKNSSQHQKEKLNSDKSENVET